MEVGTAPIFGELLAGRETELLMAATMKKAIPTEYLGVRYRSKSEAQFALALGMCGKHQVLEYEPQFLGVDDWVPDFLILSQKEPGTEIEALIIELKPTSPTETYLSNLASKMQAARDCLYFPQIEALVISGSFYQSNIFQVRELSACLPCEDGFFKPAYDLVFHETKQQAVLNYRFDLEHGGNSGGRLDTDSD